MEIVKALDITIKVFSLMSMIGSLQGTEKAFEVASIRASTPSDVRTAGTRFSPNGLTVVNRSLSEIIRVAYDVQLFQIIGPNWLSDQKYDITARAETSATRQEIAAMLRVLLVERFKLQTHREARTVDVYELSVGKIAPRLEAASPDEMTPPPRTMPALAALLSNYVGRPVVDKTDLKGNFRIKLDLRHDDGVGIRDRFFNAVETLGLRLIPARDSIECIVIDRVERLAVEN
jgi:uncharacterized protein (TIGR03435 family)